LLLLLRLIFNKHPEIKKKTSRGARNKESKRHLDRSSELFLSLVHVLAHTATTVIVAISSDTAFVQVLPLLSLSVIIIFSLLSEKLVIKLFSLSSIRMLSAM